VGSSVSSRFPTTSASLQPGRTSLNIRVSLRAIFGSITARANRTEPAVLSVPAGERSCSTNQPFGRINPSPDTDACRAVLRPTLGTSTAAAFSAHAPRTWDPTVRRFRLLRCQFGTERLRTANVAAVTTSFSCVPWTSASAA